MTDGGRVATAGRIFFLPWLHLPHPVIIGGFRFVPVNTADLDSIVRPEVAQTIGKAMRTHVDQGGKPIEACTLILRRRGPSAWSLPERLWDRAQRASEILALVCLSEQRFFEGHLAPHLNATMFRLVGQNIEVGSDYIGIIYPRRGSALRVGGLKFRDVVFQQPPQIEGTECKVVNVRLARALQRAYRADDAVWKRIAASLPLFLLGHTESADLRWNTPLAFSAMAFEQLLEIKGDATAQTFACALADLWPPHYRIEVANSKRIRPDPKWSDIQARWPVHRKWAKELYEVRSSSVHRGERKEFSRNWEGWQHLVAAAFIYPLAVKLHLQAAKLYQMSDKEIGACDALDALLDSDLSSDNLIFSEWSDILSHHEATRELDRIVSASMAKAGF